MEAQLAEFRNKGMMQDASISKSSNEFAFKNVNIRITAVNDNTLFSVTNEKGTSNVNIVRSIINNQVSFYEDEQQPGDWWAQCQYPAKTQLCVIFESPDSPQYGYQWYIEPGETESYGAHYIDEAGNPDTDYSYVYFRDSEDKVLVDDKYQYYIKGIQEPEPYTSTQILGTYIGKCILGDYLIIFTKESGRDRIYRCSILDNGNLLADCIVDRDLGFVGPVETVGYYEREDIQKVYWVDGTNPNRSINIMLDADEQPDSFDFLPNIESVPAISVEKEYNGAGSFPAGTIQYFVSYYNSLGQETKIANATPLYYITRNNRGGAPGDTLSCSFNISITKV